MEVLPGDVLDVWQNWIVIKNQRKDFLVRFTFFA